MSLTATDLPPAANAPAPPAFRPDPTPADALAIRALVAATGFFHGYEVDVAVELVQERLARGEPSGYRFIFADGAESSLAGYACYGPIACTAGSFDLYWVVVHPSQQGRGLGRRLVAEVERLAALDGGRKVYIETSSRPQYEPTRAFYQRCGYTLEAHLPDFYAAGDGKLIYNKALAPPAL